MIASDELPDDPFYVADVGEIISQHSRWVSSLPKVSPYYAVKCNPDPLILRALAGLGTGFDCASRAEIAAVLNLNMDINPSTHIVYANPCKAASHIRYAASVGVRMMTFDNADELYKIKKYHNYSPQLILRILTDDSRSVCRFGVKFGATISQVSELLKIAQDLQLDVIGISFHVGSGCYDASLFRDAIKAAREAFDIGQALGFNFTLLDIGGGFPGVESTTGIKFSEIAAVVKPALEEMFSGVTVISEPGRFFASSAYTLAVNVHARRIVPHSSGDPTQKTYMYYINEGLYSSLNCIYFDHAMLKPKVLHKGGVFCDKQSNDESVIGGESQLKKTEIEYGCSIWGPTCDSMDMITRDGRLPELNVGDWLYFEAMGAYTVSAATTFNGFAKCPVLWTNSKDNRATDAQVL